jgi:ABC-type multidrug transport system permease subunit
MMMYSVFYNNSLEDDMFISGFNKPTPRDPVMIQLKLSLDNSIMKYLGKEKGMLASDIPQIEMTHGIYPLISSRMIKGINLVTGVGAYFFILTPLLTFTVILNELVREKELKLRQGLSVVGVKHGVYWISWFIVGIIFSTLTTTVLIIAGLLCQFDIFWNIPIMMTFLVFFVFSMAMISFGFFMSTLLH